MIFGERGVGKTSLANVLSEFANIFIDSPVVCRRVNCDSGDDFSSVWKKYFGQILISVQRPGIGFEADATSLAVNLLEKLPGTITTDIVRQTLVQLSNNFMSVVIIDEFDRLLPERAALFADCIKTLSDYAVPSTVVLVGVADSVDGLIREHASVERAVVQVPMPRMSHDEIHQIIQNGLNRISMNTSDACLNQISFLAQGLPHYAHLLGLHSSRAALDHEMLSITMDHIEQAIQASTGAAQQSIRTAYTKATSSPRKDNLFKQVLLACALAQTDDLGYFSASDVRNPMSTIMGQHYDIPSFARHLKEFSEPIRGHVLSKTGPERRIRYRFVNPLMQPYVVMRGVAEGLIGRNEVSRLRA